MSVTRRTGWYLLSSLGVPIVSLATLPLFTTKLGPEEFGLFALGSALAGIVSATAVSFSMVSLPAQLARLSTSERRPFISAVVLSTLITSLIITLLIVLTSTLIPKNLGLESLSDEVLALSMAGGILNSLWGVCIEILTIDGHAKNYAITTMLQVFGNIIAISLALFVFGHTQDALFWGFAFSGLIGTISAISMLAPLMQCHHLRPWLKKACHGSHAAIVSSLSENGKQVLERVYVSALLGVGPLGLLAHAQYYKNAAMIAINALSRGVLPTALAEARAENPLFSTTIGLWKLVQAFALAVALGFALIGKEVIGLLTHGKFVTSTPYAVALLTILLLQTAAKPHNLLMMARGKGHIQAHLSTLSLIIAIVWLLVSVPYLGLWGIISSFCLQTFVHRAGLYKAANRLCPIPFSDHWVVTGIPLLGTCALIASYGEITLVWRIAILIVLYALILWQLKPSFAIMRSMHPKA